MTPPDAMSWDEAVNILEREFIDANAYRWSDDNTHSDECRRREEMSKTALAAIQSHRVQAEADARRYRWLRDVAGDDWEVRRDLSDFTSELLYSEHLDTAIDAALAAAANNDGGSNEQHS